MSDDHKVGDYEWKQISMWDFAPDKCIEKWVRDTHSDMVFHYCLLRITETFPSGSRKMETVESTDGVPLTVLHWRNDDYKLKGEESLLSKIYPLPPFPTIKKGEDK